MGLMICKTLNRIEVKACIQQIVCAYFIDYVNKYDTITLPQIVLLFRTSLGDVLLPRGILKFESKN